jgi:hypothetical protein
MPVVLGSEAGPAAAPGLAGRGQAAGELFAVIEAQGLPPGVQLPVWTSSTLPTEAWPAERIALSRT